MSEYSPDRVQGMLGAAERWQKVSPKAVVSGSTAQAENVLTDAIHDIACLWRVANESATEIASLRRELEEARAKALDEAIALVNAMPAHSYPSIEFAHSARIAAAIRKLAEPDAILADIDTKGGE